jgi:uncharacterized membrane protein
VNSFDQWEASAPEPDPELARGAVRFVGGCLMFMIAGVGMISVVVHLAKWDWQLVALVALVWIVSWMGDDDGVSR